MDCRPEAREARAVSAFALLVSLVAAPAFTAARHAALGVDSTAWLAMSMGHAGMTTIRIEPDDTMRVIAVGDIAHVPPPTRTGAPPRSSRGGRVARVASGETRSRAAS